MSADKDKATKTFDKNGEALHVGDFYVTDDGQVFKMNGITAVPQPGINAEYAYQVRKATAAEAKTWTEKHPKSGGSDGDSIIWGS